jgi:hemerythrin superfamily protein
MYNEEKFAAVEDNFIHIHGALLTDLGRIVDGEKHVFFESFPRFARILSKHTEIEDRLFFPALEKRAPGATRIVDLPHKEIEDHLAKLLTWSRGIDYPGQCQVRERLMCFERELETHLLEERRVVMPAMMENFSAAELWALDGRIMEFCSPEFMQEMMPWWFIHMDLAGRVAVAQNMLGGVDPDFVPVLCQWISDGLDTEAWLELLTRVPALAQGPTRVEVQVAF